jgi:hypothetical protein
MKRICVSIGHTILLSTSNKRNCPTSNKSSGTTYDSNSTVSPESFIKSLYSYTQYHWLPIAFIVIAGFTTSSLKYNNTNDGNAINTNTIAGNIVHTTSNVAPCIKYLYANT